MNFQSTAKLAVCVAAADWGISMLMNTQAIKGSLPDQLSSHYAARAAAPVPSAVADMIAVVAGVWVSNFVAGVKVA